MGVDSRTTVCRHGGGFTAGSTRVSFSFFLDSSGLAVRVARSMKGMGVGRQVVTDEVLYLRSAGLDLGKRFLLACVRVPNPKKQGTWSLETERFGTTPAEVRRLLAWLTERRVELVVMEATSDYWRPVYYTLQESLNLMLVNPAHLKGIRGRKSDPSDAAFLARAGASGLVMASFVPERAIRELRDLARRRTEVVVARGQEAQRLEKELEDTGMKLTSVLTDVTGLSSRRILDSLIGGERDTRRLAELTFGAARKKIPALVEALDGTFTDHHAFMCRHYLDQIDHLDTVVSALDARIVKLMGDHDQDLANLDTIPGIGRLAAEIIIAETGGDMAQFASAQPRLVDRRLPRAERVGRGEQVRSTSALATSTSSGCSGWPRWPRSTTRTPTSPCSTGASPAAGVASARWSRSCTSSPSRSGTSCTTTSPTANSAQTTSPSEIHNEPYAV